MQNSIQNNYSKLITSDQLHNQNCYRFLQKLRLPTKDSQDLVPEIAHLVRIQQSNYDKTYAYGTLYTRFMTSLDRIIATGALAGCEWDAFFRSLYINDNDNLVETYLMMRDCVLEKSPSGLSVQQLLSQRNDENGHNINQITPAQSGSKPFLCLAMVWPNYKPSHWTNLSSVRRYCYNTGAVSQELRMGTQGQYHGYVSQVDPVFKRFLRAQKSRRSNAPITHIYFNNLPQDLYPFTYQKLFEGNLTQALQGLEQEFPNIAVITLPAAMGLMAHDDIAHTDVVFKRHVIKQLFLDIAFESTAAKHMIKDFHISSKIRNLLFGTPENEQAVLTRLLEDSFQKMGLGDQEELLPAQRQAVWFHFIKFELPRYIITTLQPDTYNFACKDAIDRGGISSAYYNLLSSFSTSQPMSRDEFEQALHAAPFMVKGRGMNDHIDIIWNAVDQYITTQKALLQGTNKHWLIDWRDANCPAVRAGELLERRLSDCMVALENRSDSSVVRHALDVLQAIKQCDRSYACNHALFLDVVVSSYAFCQDPQLLLDDKKLMHYDHLIEKMLTCDEQPVSWMETFLRLLRFLCCMQQPRKTHTNDYANLIGKMGQWRSVSKSTEHTSDSYKFCLLDQTGDLSMKFN
ncbi:MAG: hypothetical protein KBB94_07215 [Legionellaceae bacterium]|nr:hypothetical protein [Legionellaceae bacterium]MBP9776047.1 hypothetical protein [Legionellaceae bacterium]